LNFQKLSLPIRSALSSEETAIIEKIIMLVIGLYVTAYTVPSAFVTIATTALTSVNPGTISLFQNLIPLIGIVTVVLLFVKSVRG
jgi:hypothetical protein